MKKILTIAYIILVFSIQGFTQKENALIREGNKLYDEKKFPEAEIEYRKSLEVAPKSFKGNFNLADALYEQKNYEEALKMFNEIASQKTSKNVKAEAYHNLGNTFLDMQELEKSIEAYKNALRNNPNDKETKYNLEYAKQLLKKQQQQQQQQDQNKDNKDQEDKDKKDENKDKQDQNKDENKQDQNKDQQDKNEDKKDENKDKQNQDQQKQDQDKKDQQKQDQQKQQQQPQPKEISKKDAERMLQALKNGEKETLEKLKKAKVAKAQRVKIEKDW
ncbi:MAG: tetratricopeptide repeat protein [Bacteroidales bacterium]|nr:tetratricopeptide repeat protein [Bacteroidales bacterium]